MQSSDADRNVRRYVATPDDTGVGQSPRSSLAHPEQATTVYSTKLLLLLLLLTKHNAAPDLEFVDTLLS